MAKNFANIFLLISSLSLISKQALEIFVNIKYPIPKDVANAVETIQIPLTIELLWWTLLTIGIITFVVGFILLLLKNWKTLRSR